MRPASASSSTAGSCCFWLSSVAIMRTRAPAARAPTNKSNSLQCFNSNALGPAGSCSSSGRCASIRLAGTATASSSPRRSSGSNWHRPACEALGLVAASSVVASVLLSPVIRISGSSASEGSGSAGGSAELSTAADGFFCCGSGSGLRSGAGVGSVDSAAALKLGSLSSASWDALSSAS